MNIDIEIKRLRQDVPIPKYRHEGDAGFDLAASEDVLVPAGKCAIVSTGLAVALPLGYELQIRLRSGTALNTPLILPNAPATIDSGYRGELGIIVRNLGSEPWLIRKDERIAQGVIAKIYRAEFWERDVLPPSDRGEAGYGSTGR